MDLRRGQSIFLCRHDIAFALVDHLHNRLFTPTMQPNFVGQIWRANALIAFAIDAMACGAHREFGFTKKGTYAPILQTKN